MSEITVGDTPPGGTVLGMRMVPSDADVETLRRAMVDAWQTWRVLADYSDMDAYNEAREATDAAVAAYLAAKRARGAP